MCPSARSSLAQGQGLRAGAGESPRPRRSSTPKEPSLSAQALLLLLSKTLAFLEIKISAAEELVRPVYALRNQARAKLEGTDTMGTCWPTSQLREARLHDTEFCPPCSGPAPRGHGTASWEGQRGSVQFRRPWGPIHSSAPQTSDHLHPLYSTAPGGSVTPGTPSSVLSGLWPHGMGGNGLWWPREKKAGTTWGASGGSNTLASASLGVSTA